jgi:hypothetical protein
LLDGKLKKEAKKKNVRELRGRGEGLRFRNLFGLQRGMMKNLTS